MAPHLGVVSQANPPRYLPWLPSCRALWATSSWVSTRTAPAHFAFSQKAGRAAAAAISTVTDHSSSPWGWLPRPIRHTFGSYLGCQTISSCRGCLTLMASMYPGCQSDFVPLLQAGPAAAAISTEMAHVGGCRAYPPHCGKLPWLPSYLTPWAA